MCHRVSHTKTTTNAELRGTKPSQISYQLLPSAYGLINSARLWALTHWIISPTVISKKMAVNYDGKHLPGVAKNTFTGGVDLNSRPGIFLHLTYYYSDKMPLDDANSAYAGAYQFGRRKDRIFHDRTKIKSYRFSPEWIMPSVPNTASATISMRLQADINNAAAKANYFIGLSVNFQQSP